jgi:hypothetical protein
MNPSYRSPTAATIVISKAVITTFNITSLTVYTRTIIQFQKVRAPATIMTSILNHLQKRRKNQGLQSKHHQKQPPKHHRKTTQPPKHISKNHESTTEITTKLRKHNRKNRQSTIFKHSATPKAKKTTKPRKHNRKNHQSTVFQRSATTKAKKKTNNDIENG